MSIYGYPSSKYSALNAEKTRFETFQYGSKQSGQLLEKNIEKGEFTYKISTEEGMSGSSIVLSVKNDYKIVGIHKGGSRTLQLNKGRLLTDKLLQDL